MIFRGVEVYDRSLKLPTALLSIDLRAVKVCPAESIGIALVLAAIERCRRIRWTRPLPDLAIVKYLADRK